MTKKEFSKTIAEELGLPQQTVKKIVQRVLDNIVESLAADGIVELRKFGVFKLKIRKSRKARNPKTGVEFIAPDKTLILFKPGSSMVSKVKEFENWRRTDQQKTAAKKSQPETSPAPLAAATVKNPKKK
jgi:integration host factor subunit beta